MRIEIIAALGQSVLLIIVGCYAAIEGITRLFNQPEVLASELMEFVPKNLNLDNVKKHILELKHVKDVHDLHASTLSTGMNILTAHVVVEDECFTNEHVLETLNRVRSCVAEHFPVSMNHSTFQIET